MSEFLKNETYYNKYMHEKKLSLFTNTHLTITTHFNNKHTIITQKLTATYIKN